MTNTIEKTCYLSTTSLKIGYRQKGREICIAEAPELKISSGDFICLLGPNGAGKSTLIRTLSGIQRPLQGAVKLDNQPYDHLNPRSRARKVSVVLTEMPSMGMLDAYSLVALGRHPYSGKFGTLEKKDRERIDWAFRAMDALKLKTRQVFKLSDGERQKLLIARALAQETPLMLLDEPTAFLDLPGQVELMVTLRALAHQEQMGILLSTHNLELALRFADHIWLLNTDGTVIKGYPEALATNGAISRTFSSNEVEWNVEKNAFSVPINPTLRATVQGNGSLCTWTARALERLGFEVVENAENTRLNVVVSKINQKPKWSMNVDGDENQFTSIENMIKWIQCQRW